MLLKRQPISGVLFWAVFLSRAVFFYIARLYCQPSTTPCAYVYSVAFLPSHIRLQFLVSDTDKDLRFELLVLDPASEFASIYAKRARNALEYKQMKKQTQEQGSPAGQTVWKISLNVRVKNMQRNDKKIKELLNEHIRKRPHSLGNPATIPYYAVCMP